MTRRAASRSSAARGPDRAARGTPLERQDCAYCDRIEVRFLAGFQPFLDPNAIERADARDGPILAARLSNLCRTGFYSAPDRGLGPVRGSKAPVDWVDCPLDTVADERTDSDGSACDPGRVGDRAARHLFMHLGLLIDAFGTPNATSKAAKPAMILAMLRLGARSCEANAVVLRAGDRLHERFLAVRV